MKRKIYCVVRTTKLYVEANSVEEAKDCAEYDDTFYEEYTDSDPVEVPYVDTGLGFKYWPEEDEE